jgi:hypothetical protein
VFPADPAACAVLQPEVADLSRKAASAASEAVPQSATEALVIAEVRAG